MASKCADPYSDANVYVVPALIPDIAILHVQVADSGGNGRIIGTRFEDVLMAQAARRVVLTAERIIDGAAFVEAPESVAIPSFLVDAVVGAGRRLALLLHAGLRIRRRVSGGLVAAARDPRRRANSSPTTSWRRHRFPRDRFRDGRRAVGHDGGRHGAAPQFRRDGLPWRGIAAADGRHAPGETPARAGSDLPEHHRRVRPAPERLPVSTVDPALLHGTRALVTLADLFDLSARGRLDVAFLRCPDRR